MPLPERFWAKVDKNGPVHPIIGSACWLWTGQLNHDGYGRFLVMGLKVRAHRLAYEALAGQIPAGLTIDHLCRVRSCVNPSHLEPVTQRENTLRGNTLAAACASRTHCPQGHPYAGDNLIVRRHGYRHCRECHRKRSRERQARLYAARKSSPTPTR